MGERVTVAYESAARERAARRKTKLRWHRSAGGGLTAKGERGEFCIVRQRPDRRHGIYRWGVTHAGHSVGSTDQLAQAKGLAAHHEFKQTCAEDGAVEMPMGLAEVRRKTKTGWKVPEGLPIDLSTYAPKGGPRGTPVSIPTPVDVSKNEFYVTTTPPGAVWDLAKFGQVGIQDDMAWIFGRTLTTVRGMIRQLGLNAKIFRIAPDNVHLERVPDDAAAEERRGGGDNYRAQVVRNLRMMGRKDAEAYADRHAVDVERYEIAEVPPNVAAAILDAADTRFDDMRAGEETAAKESPTRGEWEVVVTNPPHEHLGHILSMAGPGYGYREGNKIYLTGFYDDEEARHVANSISRKYRAQVTYGPRRKMEAAEDSHPGAAESGARVKKGDTKTSDADGGVTWTVIHVAAGGDIVISVRPHDGRRPYETTVSRAEWASMPRHETAEERRRPGAHRHEKEEPCEHGCPTGECKPFTKLERDPVKFKACMARAEQIGELNTSRKLYDLVRHDIEKRDREVFLVCCIDFRGSLREYVELSVGQRHRVAVDVEDILQVIILSGCDGAAVAHCHPSGNPEPSQADRQLTKSIEKAMAVACPNVKLVDHIIVGSDAYFSFSDRKSYKIKH